ncbi:IFT54 [Mytilus edulis]|uniref:TRAF3-interacting protein 1 n=1 Tax=Mytilus edulis TaxID=6550 RepID=A0A8S3QFQ4_MYTED|nr:IFT54 [Mytilus edulis]
MDSKLKSVRAGHKGAVTKLLVKFDELKSKTDTEVDEVKALDDAVTQKQKTLIDLNNRLLEQTSEENLEQEITDSDEYMYELDCKIRQIRKFIKSFETNTIISHDTVGPSTSRLNPDAYHFTPEARVDMNRCAIDSMNQQYSIHAPAVHIRPSENVMFQVPYHFKTTDKMSLDPKIVKKTQDSLGKIIKKPPLTDKLLGKPPFRFLHDIMTSVIKTTGFMKGLFTEAEMNSENVKDRDSKVAFLQKAVDMVAIATKKSMSVKPAKIVAGHEPEKTNEFLQLLATAINANADNGAIVDKVLNKAGDTAEEPKKEKPKEEKKRESREKDEKRSKDDRKEKDERREKDERKDKDRRDRDRSRDKDDKGEKSRDRDREERRREREDRHKDKDDKHRDREKRHRDKDEEKERRRKEKEEEAGKENEPALMNGGEAESEQPQRVARPTSAKGSRRRHGGRHVASSDEEDEPKRQIQASTEPSMGEADLPPQVVASRKAGRPSSARPAPPRRKEQTMVENEPAMRLGSGQPTNVIVDDGQNSDDEEDETFVVEETAPPPPDSDQEETAPDGALSRPLEDGDDEDHGGLVKKILETKKELEGPQQTKKTEIERSGMSDAQRRKQREQVQKEVDKLRGSIQTLTRSANPLGKIMDYVQEDLDSMQKELERWKTENKEHQIELKREKGVTDKAVEPLKAQLSEVDQAIKDQLDLIVATKSNIARNDQKIDKLLQSVTRS